jgi:hypothetical protein
VRNIKDAVIFRVVIILRLARCYTSPLVWPPTSLADPISVSLPYGTATWRYACGADTSVTVGGGAVVTADPGVEITSATVVCTGCLDGLAVGSSSDTVLSIQYMYSGGYGSRLG